MEVDDADLQNIFGDLAASFSLAQLNIKVPSSLCFTPLKNCLSFPSCVEAR